MHLLFIGDIVWRPGRDLVRLGLAALVEQSDAVAIGARLTHMLCERL